MGQFSGSTSQTRRGHWILKIFGGICLNQLVRTRRVELLLTSGSVRDRHRRYGDFVSYDAANKIVFNKSEV